MCCFKVFTFRTNEQIDEIVNAWHRRVVEVFHVGHEVLVYRLGCLLVNYIVLRQFILYFCHFKNYFKRLVNSF